MYRKTLILLAVILLPYCIKAQEYKLSFEQRCNLSVYNFSSDFHYNIPGRNLKPRLGFESELRFNYTPKKKATFYIGVGFTKYNYTSGKFEVRFSDQIIPKDGFTPPAEDENLFSAARFNQSYNYLSIPIGMQFHPNKKLMFGAGMKVLRKLSVYSYSVFYYPDRWKPESNYDKKTFDNRGYENWLLSTHAEVGYIVPILKYNITWKAMFEYSVTDFFAKEHPKLHLHPYTISIGGSFPLLVKSKN